MSIGIPFYGLRNLSYIACKMDYMCPFSMSAINECSLECFLLLNRAPVGVEGEEDQDPEAERRARVCQEEHPHCQVWRQGHDQEGPPGHRHRPLRGEPVS